VLGIGLPPGVSAAPDSPRLSLVARARRRVAWVARFPGRSIGAALLALGGAVFLARFLQQSSPNAFWFVRALATIWLWQLVLSASCLAAGHWAVSRLIPAHARGSLETLALSFPIGLAIFVVGMYVGGFLHLYGPVFAVAWPATLLLGTWRATRGAWLRARQSGGLRPSVQLRGLPLVASLFGLLALGLLYLGALSPGAVNYDAAWMHLVIAQEYARAGHIIGFPGDWTKGEVHLGSVVNTWSFLVPGLDMPALRWMMALHTEFSMVVWTLVGVAAAARWLARRDARATWVMFFLFPAIFIYDSNIGGAADHFLALFMAPLLLATGAALRRFERGRCFLWGVVAGAALLTKYQSCYVLLPLALWTLARVARLALRWRRGDASAVAPRAMVAGLGLAAAGALLVTLPHFGSSLVFYKNPFYPFLQNVIPSAPTVPDAAAQMNNIVADWHVKPPFALSERLPAALKMLVTFSFVPHYSFSNGLPIYGSLFTLALPLLLILGRARKIWIGAAIAVGAIFLWADTYWVDRNLQTFCPILVAVTAAIFVRAWELGRLARLGVAMLALVQVVWAGNLYFTGSDRMAESFSLFRNGFEGHAREQLENYRGEYLALNKALPKDAVVMLHYLHGSLGIEHPVILDWVGYQGVIDYRRFRTPGDLYARLKQLGVTHVVKGSNPHAADYRQEEVIFDAFVDLYGRSPQQFGSLSMFPMPPQPPQPAAPYQVLAIGLPGYKDGLYPVESLSTCEQLPPEYQHRAEPLRTGPSFATLARDAQAALVGQNVALDAPTQEIISREFREVRTADGFRVLLR
jgi:hypothetical protein